jgi:PAS domain-containing protein
MAGWVITPATGGPWYPKDLSVPTPLDPDSPFAAYVIDLSTGGLEWTAGMYRIYGFEPGSVAMTMDRLLDHKHPDDRARAARLLRYSDARQGFQHEHRIFRADGTERTVVVNGVVDEEKQIQFGTAADVTIAVRYRSGDDEHRPDDGVDHWVAAVASRDVIGQAKGILMERFQITEERAFQTLQRISRDHQTKLRLVAEDLVRTRQLPE